MGEVAKADEYLRSEIALLSYSDATFKPPLSPLIIHIDPLTPTGSSPSEAHPSLTHQHPKDAWLPITESRNGNAFYAAFHVLNSNIGFQALMLPLAFATLGWYVMPHSLTTFQTCLIKIWKFLLPFSTPVLFIQLRYIIIIIII